MFFMFISVFIGKIPKRITNFNRHNRRSTGARTHCSGLEEGVELQIPPSDMLNMLFWRHSPLGFYIEWSLGSLALRNDAQQWFLTEKLVNN